MKKKIKRFGAAYVRFEGLGGYQEKLVSAMIENDIQFYEVRQGKAVISAVIRPADYLFVSRMGKKYGIKIKAVERYGLYYRLYNYRRRWGIILGALCCCAVIVILSQFVWDIRISGNDSVSDAEICRSLENSGIMPGAGRLSFDARACEMKAMLDISELSWISIERIGSRVYVKVGETENSELPKVSINTPCNIISDYDGQLIYAEVKRGTMQKGVGSGVAKGQLLVSGAVNDNGGRIIYVHSEGYFIARCEQTEEFYLTYRQTEKIPDGEEYHTGYFLFGNYAVPLFGSNISANDASEYKYTENTYNISFLGIDTGLKWRRGIYTKYTEKDVIYTNSDIIAKLEKQKTDFEENFLSDCDIVSSEKEFLPDEKGIKLTVRYVVDREIGVKEPITIIYDENTESKSSDTQSR